MTYLENVKEIEFVFEVEIIPPIYVYKFTYNDDKIINKEYHSVSDSSELKSDIKYLRNNGVKIISTHHKWCCLLCLF
jgi:hypothetical protein